MIHDLDNKHENKDIKKMDMEDIEYKNFKNKMSYIGLIGILIGVLLMMWVVLIPNVPHARGIDISLSAGFFGIGGLFLLMLSY